MDLQQLKTFIVLAQYENMPATAEIMETSQPQISKTLAALESELNVRLFDRVGRGIRLNEHGAVFLQYANDAISSMMDGQLAMQHVKDAALGTITIGCTAFAPILSPVVRAYARKNPQTSFRYVNPSPGDRNLLKSVDLLLSPATHSQYNFKSFFPVFRIFLQEKYHLICSPRFHAFPEQKQSLSYDEYKNLPFIISGSTNAGMLYSDYSVLETISSTLGAAPPRIAFQVNDFDQKMQLVADCLGMSLLPESCLPFAHRLVPGLRVFSTEETDYTRAVAIARPRRSSLSPIAQDFWDFILEFRHLEPDTAR